MRAIKCVTILLVVLFSLSAMAQEGAAPVKTIAIGDIDAGYNVSGQKAYDVKENIQLALKRAIEKQGKGRYQVNIVSSAVVVEGAKAPESQMPTMPTNRPPTKEEMAQMQQWTEIMMGKKKVHKPVNADFFVEGQVRSAQSGVDTGAAASTLSSMTGVGMSLGDVSTKKTRVDLVCTMRNPATGALIDRYVAKASKVKFRNVGGVTTYDWGDNSITYEKLFQSAVNKCAKWVIQMADSSVQ